MANVKVVHRKEPHDFYIGRPSILGNPFSHNPGTLAQTQVATRQIAVARFREYAWERMQLDPEFRNAIIACDGKTVGCWCKPRDCHGDTFEYLIDRWNREHPPCPVS
jgi:hypothetical protein